MPCRQIVTTNHAHYDHISCASSDHHTIPPEFRSNESYGGCWVCCFPAAWPQLTGWLMWLRTEAKPEDTSTANEKVLAGLLQAWTSRVPWHKTWAVWFRREVQYWITTTFQHLQFCSSDSCRMKLKTKLNGSKVSTSYLYSYLHHHSQPTPM